MKKAFNKIRTTLTIVLAIMAFVVAVIGVLATVPKNGNFKMLVVQTGSMEPKIPVGSLIISRKAASYQVGDIVTYAMKNNFVTHRIVAKENGNYITQGDANNEPDDNPVAPSSIIGKLWISLPFVGRFIAFVKTPLGFSLIIVLPSLLIVINEILAIGKELSKAELKKQARQKLEITPRRVLMVDGVRSKPLRKRTTKTSGVVAHRRKRKITSKRALQEAAATKKRISQAVAMLLITIVSLIGGTKAYFSDLGLSSNNDFGVREKFIADTLVINELVYNSSCSDGQIIELWNGSSSDVNIKNWSLRDENNTTLQITNSNTTIAAGQFALLAKSNSVYNSSCYGPAPSGVLTVNMGGNPPINTSSGSLSLVDKNNVVIDTVSYGSPNPSAAQDKSIERKRLGFDTATDGNFNASDFMSQFPATLGFALPVPQPVVINEFMVAPDSGAVQEFIELRNNSAASVDISNWKVFSGDGTTLEATVPASTTLSSGQRYLHQYVAKGDEISDTNDKLILKDASSVIQDAFSYHKFAPASGTSWSRIPEGTNTWVLDSSETPGTANVL